MIDLATIAVPLSIHLGQKLIDSVFARARRGQTVVADAQAGVARVPEQQPAVRAPSLGRPPTRLQRVYVDTLLADSIAPNTYEKCIMLVLVVDEASSENTLLFDSEVGQSLAVDLPEGVYSFYSFLVDSRYSRIDVAPLYGLGLPVHGDIAEQAAQADALELEDPDDIFALMVDAPLDVVAGGPDTLQLIVVDTSQYAHLPKTFGEFLQGQDGPLTGPWWIEDVIEDGGNAQSSIELVQNGGHLSGVATTSFLEEGVEWIVQQILTGAVDDANRVDLVSYQVRILKGPSDGYYNPDAWYGSIQDLNTIVGVSIDSEGRRGQFVMTREG
jgi:hypothetical protein